MPPFFSTTPLKHAVGCGDWVLARWFLQHNADPGINLKGLRVIYNISDEDVEAVETRFQNLLQEIRRERMSISNLC
jgi:hypothetical protein